MPWPDGEVDSCSLSVWHTAAMAKRSRDPNQMAKLVLGMLLVIDALIEANKGFDLLLLPNRRHCFGNEDDGTILPAT